MNATAPETVKILPPKAVPRCRQRRKFPTLVDLASKRTIPGPPQQYSNPFLTKTIFRSVSSAKSTLMQRQRGLLKQDREKDGRGWDPDGDGYACYWDPRPFRQLFNRLRVNDDTSPSPNFTERRIRRAYKAQRMILLHQQIAQMLSCLRLPQRDRMGLDPNFRSLRMGPDDQSGRCLKRSTRYATCLAPAGQSLGTGETG